MPVEVAPRRARTLAVRWLVEFARQRREKTMAQRLANELMDAANGVGASVKRRDDMQKMAESNKAFAHYRWEPPGAPLRAPSAQRSRNKGWPCRRFLYVPCDRASSRSPLCSQDANEEVMADGEP